MSDTYRYNIYFKDRYTDALLETLERLGLYDGGVLNHADVEKMLNISLQAFGKPDELYISRSSLGDLGKVTKKNEKK